MKALQLKGLSVSRPSIITELSMAGGGKLVGQNGEFNAGSNKELFGMLQALASASQQGNVLTTEKQVETASAAAARKREMVEAAFASKEELVALGEVFAAEMQVTGNRDGFARRLLQRMELEQGQEPKVTVDMKQSVAVLSTGPAQVATHLVRDNVYYPQEFYLQARPYIEQKDLARGPATLLDRTYISTLEAFMVAEDRLWKRLADASVGVANEQTILAGQVTTRALANMVSNITQWGLPAAFWLISSDILTDIISEESWVNTFNATSYAEELIQTGNIGNVYGLEVITDQFRHSQHKVLGRGEMYVVSSPENHGVYSDRDGIEARPIDETTERFPGRGWTMSQLTAMSIINSRTVTKAIRQ
ncbi:major head protein [Pseudomonas phage vB_PpuM-Peetri]